MKKFIKKLTISLVKLKKLIALCKSFSQPLCRIEEIDVANNRIIIHCQGARSLIKTTIEEAILESAIIDNLSARQACWLGYYHGKALREGKLKQNPTKTGFLLRYSQKRYNVVALEHQSLKIIYIDTKTRAEHSQHVISLARDKEFLKNISSSQACYIGIWAGIAVAKHGPGILNKELKLPPYLRIVK